MAGHCRRREAEVGAPCMPYAKSRTQRFLREQRGRCRICAEPAQDVSFRKHVESPTHSQPNAGVARCKAIASAGGHPDIGSPAELAHVARAAAQEMDDDERAQLQSRNVLGSSASAGRADPQTIWEARGVPRLVASRRRSSLTRCDHVLLRWIAHTRRGARRRAQPAPPQVRSRRVPARQPSLERSNMPPPR